MNLRQTTILVVFTTFLLLALVLSLSLQNVLSTYFQNQEVQQNNLNLQRVSAAFKSNFTILNYLADDWSNRIDTLEFVQNANQQFITNNLTESTFNKLDVNIVIIKDNNGNTIFARGYDLDKDQFTIISPDLQPYLERNQSILDFTDGSENNNGLIIVDGKPLLVVSSAVTGAQPTGDIFGYFVIGRFFGDTEVQKLAQQVKFPIKVVSMSEPSLSNDFALAKNYFSTSSEDTYSLPLTETNLGGYLLLKDVNQQPALIMRIEQFRDLARNSQLLLTYLYLALISSSLVFAAIFFALIERTILSRVFRLNKEVQAIANNPEISYQVTIDKKDEISVLSQNINHMLDSLKYAEFERSIFEQRLKGIVASIDDIIFNVNKDLSEIKFFGNHSFLKVLNVSNSEYIKIKSDTSSIPDDWIDFHREKAVRVLAGEHLVYEWEVPSHEQIDYYQISLSPMLGSDGIISGIVGVARNVNDLRGMQFELKQRFDELSILFHMSRLFLEQKPLIQIEQEICQLMSDHFAAEYAWIGLFEQDGDGLLPIASANIPLSDINLAGIKKGISKGEKTLNSELIKITQPASLENKPSDPVQWVLPLSWEGGLKMGLFIQLSRTSKLTDQQENFLQSFGNLSELVLSNTMLIEEVKKGRKRMQDLSHQLVKVQEEERRWLARELHDEIGQYLTALKLQLDYDSFYGKYDIERIKKAGTIANELIDKVRQMSLDLRPGILDDLGLLPALEWYFERYQDQSGIKVDFNHQQLKDRRFPAEIELTLFRVVQESLTNVARHAKVNTVNVNINATDKVIYLIVQDAGAGFDQESDWAGKSNGIIGMLERVNLVGGHFEIHSRINEGTMINVELPVTLEIENDN